MKISWQKNRSGLRCARHTGAGSRCRCPIAGVLLLPSNGWGSSWAQVQEGATGSGLDHQESSHCCFAHFGGGVGTMQKGGRQELSQHSRPVPEPWNVSGGVSANATQAGVILPLEVVRGRPQPAPSAGSALNASANPEKITDSQKGHKAVNIMNSTHTLLGASHIIPLGPGHSQRAHTSLGSFFFLLFWFLTNRKSSTHVTCPWWSRSAKEVKEAWPSMWHLTPKPCLLELWLTMLILTVHRSSLSFRATVRQQEPCVCPEARLSSTLVCSELILRNSFNPVG